MTWKTLAEKTNSLPPGWNSADEICTELDCEPNEVPKILAAAIAQGLVEKQTFPHWQDGSRHLLYCVGYRKVTGRPATPPAKGKTTPAAASDPLTAVILAKHARHPHLTPARLREYLPKKFRSSTSKEQIAAILGQ